MLRGLFAAGLTSTSLICTLHACVSPFRCLHLIARGLQGEIRHWSLCWMIAVAYTMFFLHQNLLVLAGSS